MTEEDLKTRREAAEAKIAEVERRRVERVAKREDVEAIEKLEREAREAEAIEKAECDYGPIGEDIQPVRVKDKYLVIVKKAPFVQMKAFHDAGKTTIEAKDRLSRAHVIFPERDEYNRWIASGDGAAIITAAADALCDLGGWGSAELVKKSGG